MLEGVGVKVILNEAELDRLFSQDAATARQGGFQNLLVGLQRRADRTTDELILTEPDLERIRRYALDYKQGGWEDTLIAIFGRSLGASLSQ